MSVGGESKHPTSDIEHRTSNGEGEEDLRTMVESLWGGAVQDGDRPEMTLKGEEKRGARGEDTLSKAIKVRPKDIAEKGASATVPEYEILRLLGEGGMGMVYEARQTSIDRNIAIKMIKPDVAKDRDECHQFLAEAVATADLDHPNIVPIHDLGKNNEGALFYAMKQVKGTSWLDLFSEKSLDQNLDILMRVADAVAFAHSRGVIHRDLKPENVMLGDFGEVLVMDWGLAAAVTAEAKADRLDPDHAIGGTPCYMAPEMAVGDAGKIGYASDIYLLGAILFEIVTGEQPHTGTDVMDCLANAAENEIAETGGEGELVDIALKAMATEPENRHESVKAFQAAVREYQQHEESIALSTRARQGLVTAKAKKNYRGFARCVFQLEEAVSLWPENGAAAEGLSAGRLAYAECALQKGDLDLAASILDGGDSSHRALSKRIHLAQKERMARQKRAKALKITALTSAVVVFVVLSGAFVWVRGEQKKAQRALASFQAEQAKRQADRKQSAPSLVETAKVLAERGDFATALLSVDTAIEYDVRHAEAHFVRACLLAHKRAYKGAVEELAIHRKLQPEDEDATRFLDICRSLDARGAAGSSKGELAAIVARRGMPVLAAAMSAEAREKLEMYRAKIEKAWPTLGGRLDLDKTGRLCLNFAVKGAAEKVKDLSPLQGIPLNSLNLTGLAVEDLDALKGMPLDTLVYLNSVHLKDISGLRNSPLRKLVLCAKSGYDKTTAMESLDGLQGTRLESLNIAYCKGIKSLEPVRGLPLNQAILQGCSSLTSIDVVDWSKIDTDDVRLRGCSTLTDLSPLGAMGTRLKRLDLCGGVGSLESLRDLGLELDYLNASWCGLKTLEGIQGNKVIELNAGGKHSNLLQDLTPLRGQPLKKLSIGTSFGSIGSNVTSLEGLEGLPLEWLSIRKSRKLKSLEPLKGLPLKHLNMESTGVSDLTPLRDLPLTSLIIHDLRDSRIRTPVTDLTPLKNLKLREIRLVAKNIKTGLEILRNMKTLTVINEIDAKEFWRKYDEGESGKK